MTGFATTGFATTGFATARFILLSRSSAQGVRLRNLDAQLGIVGDETVTDTELPSVVAHLEPQHPRWVFDDTSRWYPSLLAAGVRVERCVDLRLSHTIVKLSSLTSASELANSEVGRWDRPPATSKRPADALFHDALFDVESLEYSESSETADDPLDEFVLQRRAVAECADPNRLGLLLAAESAGALIAAEMTFAGLPWRADEHDRILSGLLGPRPLTGRPVLLEQALQDARNAFADPDLNPDSPADLLKSLRRAGLMVNSTRSWELKKLDHPGIQPLLHYKKLARLHSANGWQWLDAWVTDGRFRPNYVPGGVVTGRWASDGGGALQLPRQIRGAVVADEGWKLVVADAAQLEPRILAALSGDVAMARAGQASDIYAAIVQAGAVETRDQAKVGMLGAMYGGTTGESGRALPRLAKAFPTALAFVEDAARAGERGEIVSTRLGRSSPRPGESWWVSQSDAYEGGDQAARARNRARGWGRFTRNFVVQGTAAEWALCWMATLRGLLWEAAVGDLRTRPHLVFFLHDELIVHTPAALADEVARMLRQSATEAGRLVFGATPVDFAITVAVVDNYAEAK